MGFTLSTVFGFGFVVPQATVAAWGDRALETVADGLAPFHWLDYCVVPSRGEFVGGVATFVVFVKESMTRYHGAGVFNITDETSGMEDSAYAAESYWQLQLAADALSAQDEPFDWYVVTSW